MPDGTLINFSRSMPYGGFHVYMQDPNTLKREEIVFIRYTTMFARTAAFAIWYDTLYDDAPPLTITIYGQL